MTMEKTEQHIIFQESWYNFHQIRRSLVTTKQCIIPKGHGTNYNQIGQKSSYYESFTIVQNFGKLTAQWFISSDRSVRSKA